jgi:hypothetical protein
VNAYSSISEERGAARRRRLLSRAYRNGLRQGFGAPALFFAPFSLPRASSIDATVANAWKAVGDALKASTKREEEEIGKGPGKATSGNRTRNR